MKSSSSASSLAQLTIVRLKEFLREPEAVFWVFFFPIVLAAGLGLAFRNRPPEVLKIAAVSPEIARSLRAEKMLDVQELDGKSAREALIAGKIALVAEPADSGTGSQYGVQYEYDDTNPEGRAARALADRAVQIAGGRKDPVAAADRLMKEPGSRYIDFLVPGLLGMNLMGSSVWSLAFGIVEARRRKLLKRLTATPMPRHEYLISILLSRLVMLILEVGTLVGFGALVFHVPLRGSIPSFLALCILGALSFSSVGRLRPRQRRDDADVDRIRRLLFRAALPRSAAARDPRAAADRTDRRPARQHAPGRRTRSARAANRRSRRVAHSELHHRAEAFPLALARAHCRAHCLIIWPSPRRSSPQPPFSPSRGLVNGYFAAAFSSTSIPQPGFVLGHR